MGRKKRVVVVGGGTGTFTVLTGLKRFAEALDLAAIVAMTDSGGSTGRLRDEFGYLPVGDVRMALAALASNGGGEDSLIRKLFLHRFATDGDVRGHNFGNLFLVALTDILGSEEKAIEAASSVLRVCGRVIPVTHTHAHLCATYDDGVEVVGEHEIDEPSEERSSRRIIALTLNPSATLSESARGALEEADLIIFGPGDLYTSVLANCVVDGFADAMHTSRAATLYIENLMTKRGQTTGMGARAHAEVLAQYIGTMPDHVLVNDTPLPAELLARYEVEGEYPVAIDCSGLSCTVRAGDFLAGEEIVRRPGDVLRRSLIRHDPDKLAGVIMEILEG